MKKSIIIISLLIVITILGIFLYITQNNNSNKNNYISERTNNNQTINTSFNNTISSPPKEKVTEEIEMAVYSTKLSGRDTPRSRNIILTSNTLNGTQINPGEKFSFCNIVGICTAEKGYEEADSFDADGNKVKTLGGGNCQVSSTIYNVVLQIPELSVVERHAHSGHVDYVPKDKDAAVSHGSVDFKFKNNLDVPIKLYIYSDLNGVNARIVKIIEKEV